MVLRSSGNARLLKVYTEDPSFYVVLGSCSVAVKLSAGFGVLVSGLEYASFLHQGYLSNLYKALGGCEDCTIFGGVPEESY